MLYFKTISFPDHIQQAQAEEALRKAALKKTLSLDFSSSTMNIGTDKKFFGFEGKDSLNFTRIKTSFEFLLPKIIINIPKDQSATAYKMRLSALPLAICLFLFFGFFSIIVGLVRGIINPEVMAVIFVLAMLYFSLLALEIKLTKSCVLKTIKKDY